MNLPAGIYRLAEEGMRLFPLRPGTKKPFAGFSWPQHATNDLNVLESWMCQYPSLNWGLMTGPRSGVYVYDVDPQGFATIRHVANDYGNDWMRTRIAKTPRGGRHLYFRWDDRHPIRSINGVVRGIDLKGAGGYVVIPPSWAPPAPGAELRPYQWKDAGLDVPIAEDRLHLAFDWQSKAAATRVHPPDESLVIPEGRRNERLFRMGASMRDRGFSTKAILAALVVTNSECCDPPLAESEVRRIAGSLARYPAEIEPSLHLAPIDHLNGNPNPKTKTTLRLFQPLSDKSVSIGEIGETDTGNKRLRETGESVSSKSLLSPNTRQKEVVNIRNTRPEGDGESRREEGAQLGEIRGTCRVEPTSEPGRVTICFRG